MHLLQTPPPPPLPAFGARGVTNPGLSGVPRAGEGFSGPPPVVGVPRSWKLCEFRTLGSTPGFPMSRRAVWELRKRWC